MTLTQALNLALDPITREEGLKALNTISHLDDYEHMPKPTPYEAQLHSCAAMILWMLGTLPKFEPLVKHFMYLLISVGADLSGAKVVNGQPDWSVTMPRLAAWADSLGVEQ